MTPTIYAFRGDRLPYSSHWAGTLSADYRTSLRDGLAAILGTTIAHVGQREGDFNPRATQPRVSVPAFTTVDLRAGVEFNDWTVQPFAKNLTDKRGLVSVVPRDTIAKQAPFQANLITPRTIGVSVTRQF